MLQAATIRTDARIHRCDTIHTHPAEYVLPLEYVVPGRPAPRTRTAGMLDWTYSGRGSFGRPSTRSPTMLRWIWLVPPQIVSDREKKNDDIIGLTG